MTIAIPETKAATSSALTELTERWGSLPSEYVRFLGTHDGATPPENVLDGTNYSVGVRRFLEANQIFRIAEGVDGMTSSFIPIAEDGSGNYICLSTDDHQVYFWDHKIDRDNLVALSFEEFLMRLQPFDLSDVRLRGGQVKSVWSDPDFKPAF